MYIAIYAKYLTGLSKLSVRGIEMVMVFADALELICSKTVYESNDGSIGTCKA